MMNQKIKHCQQIVTNYASQCFINLIFWLDIHSSELLKQNVFQKYITFENKSFSEICCGTEFFCSDLSFPQWQWYNNDSAAIYTDS